MYRFNRIATMKNSADVQGVIGYASELTTYVNGQYDLGLHMGIEMFGGSKIHWSADFASLAEFETKFGKLMADRDYFAMLERGRKFWVDGSVQDSIYVEAI